MNISRRTRCALALASWVLAAGASAQTISSATARPPAGALSPQFLQRHTTSYAVDLDRDGVPILEQNDAPTCTIHAAIGLHQVFHRGDPRFMNVSDAWLIAQRILLRASDALERPGVNLYPGADIEDTEFLIRRAGLVPAAVYNPDKRFKKFGPVTRLAEHVSNRVAVFWEDASAAPRARREALKLKARADVKTLIETYLGARLPEPTDEFVVAGTTYDALSYGRAFADMGGAGMTRYVLRRPPLRGELKAYARTEMYPFVDYYPELRANEVRRKTADAEEIEARVVRSLRAGRPVGIFLNAALGHISRPDDGQGPQSLGIMSVSGFAVPEDARMAGFSVLKGLQDFDDAQHVAVIVGADLGPDGRVVKFKLRNSWGADRGDRGDRGFYHMYRDYFETFAYHVVVWE